MVLTRQLAFASAVTSVLPRLIAPGVLLIATADPLAAQDVRRNQSPLDLPRPGYERRVLRLGTAELRYDIDVTAAYDDNVFATPTNTIDDVIFVARPSFSLDLSRASTDLHAEAYAEVREYAQIDSESSVSYGAMASASFRFAQDHQSSLQGRYDRAIESRADPEARVPFTREPGKIDILAGELSHVWRTSRIQLDLTGALESLNYLDPAEADRDMKTYRASTRLTLRPAAPIALFGEAFYNRRDYKLPVDRSGIDRDATTIGLLVGVSRDISGALGGRIGFGLFRFNPDDPGLRPDTGFAASGEVFWRPRVRTAATLRFFNGDVATVRAGATGRTDTRVSLRVDQEARHNVLLYGSAQWTRSKYRGSSNNRLDTWSLEGGGEYLISRHISLFASVSYARRRADRPLDEFSRTRAEFGIRIR